MTPHQRAQLEVRQEVAKQVLRWGRHHDDQHKPHDWLAIIIREASAAAFSLSKPAFRAALRKTAAVCISAMVWCEQGEGNARSNQKAIGQPKGQHG